jgi:hypothetical protein
MHSHRAGKKQLALRISMTAWQQPIQSVVIFRAMLPGTFQYLRMNAAHRGEPGDGFESPALKAH